MFFIYSVLYFLSDTSLCVSHWNFFYISSGCSLSFISCLILHILLLFFSGCVPVEFGRGGFPKQWPKPLFYFFLYCKLIVAPIAFQCFDIFFATSSVVLSTFCDKSAVGALVILYRNFPIVVAAHNTLFSSRSRFEASK